MAGSTTIEIDLVCLSVCSWCWCVTAPGAGLTSLAFLLCSASFSLKVSFSGLLTGFGATSGTGAVKEGWGGGRGGREGGEGGEGGVGREGGGEGGRRGRGGEGGREGGRRGG